MNKLSSSYLFSKSVQNGGRAVSSEAHWVPNTDVYVTESGVVIKVELAGMRKEDLELTVEGSRLKINGSRPDGCRPAKCCFQLMEINYGSFESVIELPGGFDLTQARATYQNGFLRIDVPAAEPPKRKSVAVPVRSEEK
jgi:HSP20 family protein